MASTHRTRPGETGPAGPTGPSATAAAAAPGASTRAGGVSGSGGSGEAQATGDTVRVRRRTTARDRRGRGPRTPLLPAQVPGFRTRAELFDQLVMEVVADLEPRWPDRLADIEFAVDDVPALPTGPVISSSDVVVDDGVPLARFFAPGVDARGRATKPRIVLYRRPVEMRAPGQFDLVDLVTDILEEQITAVLGEGQD